MDALQKVTSYLLLALLASLFHVKSNAQTITTTGELKQWHPITITLDGPQSSEDATPNPFLDYRFEVIFSRAELSITVPGYFAADGNAGETGATSGNKWRVHFVPPLTGTWTFRTSFREGTDVALSTDPNAGTGVDLYNNIFDSVTITGSDKGGADFRGKGTLRYTGEHYLQFDNGEYYIKGGADSPENFLAYEEFDATFNSGGVDYIKSYSPHIADWQEGDPTWQGTKGKGIIGAVNYLAQEGINSVYFLTMNVQGDTEDVWMYTNPNERFRYDVSKLDQWNIVFDHMDTKGIMLHVVTQETENDLLLDGGDLGRERKSYYRELVARFAYHHAVIWNLGEENRRNTDEQRKSFADFIRAIDPYNHPIVVHTFPGEWQQTYEPLLGYDNFEGPSLQIADPSDAHGLTLDWVNQSSQAGKKWFVTIDESGPWEDGATPDGPGNNHAEQRKEILWGNLMAGGGGVEWYFGYNHPHSDFTLEDFRSRDNFWDYTRFALEFFHQNLPFHEMQSMNDLASNTESYVFAKEDAVYAIYLQNGGTTTLDLNESTHTFTVQWFNPREGGNLMSGSVAEVTGPGIVSLGPPPREQTEDWVALVKVKEDVLYGDVSADGEVTAFDASLILQHAIDLINLDTDAQIVADVSGNGQITAFDGAMILQRVIDLITCFPAENACSGKRANGEFVESTVSLKKSEISNEVHLIELKRDTHSHLSQSIHIDIDLANKYVVVQLEYNLPEDWQVFLYEEADRVQIAAAGLPANLPENLVKLRATPSTKNNENRFVQASVIVDESAHKTAHLSETPTTPENYVLSSNYPNPFNPETTIHYSIPTSGQVKLEIFDLTGRKVRTLVNATQSPGEYDVVFDASELPSGIYLYRLETESYQNTRKMTLLK